MLNPRLIRTHPRHGAVPYRHANDRPHAIKFRGVW
jgi:hypothetical protein